MLTFFNCYSVVNFQKYFLQSTLNNLIKFSKALEIDYPITADIFYELGKSYDEESLQQRMAAENE